MYNADELRRRVVEEVKRRKSNGETYGAIGRDLGVDGSMVWHWERGKKIGLKALALLNTAPEVQQAA